MLKKQIEAMIFAVQDGLTAEEIAGKLGRQEKEVVDVLEDLAMDYEDRGFQVVSEGNRWKMIIEPRMTGLVKEVTPMEISKSVLKTLAAIAYHNPAAQSDIVKIRGNKAYGHIETLEDKGFISSKPFGRTSKIRLTDKFFEYFQVDRGEEKYLFKEKGNQMEGEQIA